MNRYSIALGKKPPKVPSEDVLRRIEEASGINEKTFRELRTTRDQERSINNSFNDFALSMAGNNAASAISAWFRTMDGIEDAGGNIPAHLIDRGIIDWQSQAQAAAQNRYEREQMMQAQRRAFIEQEEYHRSRESYGRV
jgi:hypothetical protein